MLAGGHSGPDPARLRAPVLSRIRSRCDRTVLTDRNSCRRSARRSRRRPATPGSPAPAPRGGRLNCPRGRPAGGRGPRTGLGRPRGQGDGVGLAEGAAMLVGGIERGLPERIDQPGMVTARAFPTRWLRRPVRPARTRGQPRRAKWRRRLGRRPRPRPARGRATHCGIGLFTGCPRRVQDADEQAAGARDICGHEAGEPQVLLYGGGQMLVVMGVGDPERVLKVAPGQPGTPRPRAGRCQGSPGSRRARSCLRTPAKERGSPAGRRVTRPDRRPRFEHRAVAESDGTQMGLSGCPCQPDGLVGPGQRGG